MHKDCFEAFLQHGLRPAQAGENTEVKLVFPTATEAAIFATFPIDISIISRNYVGQYSLDCFPEGSLGHFIYSDAYTLLSAHDLRCIPTVAVLKLTTSVLGVD